jgi:uncharacterized protein (DUF433 family)
MPLRFYPRGSSGSRAGTTLALTPTRRRINKLLSKGLRSHSGWRGFIGEKRDATREGKHKARSADRREHPQMIYSPVVERMEMDSGAKVIVRDPEILGGIPVFRGTRVPFKNLLDYLEGGHNLDEFLEEFPSVTRQAAIAALEHAKELVIAQTR